MSKKLRSPAGIIHRSLLIAIFATLVILFAIYIFRQAALPMPRGADGKPVLPLPSPTVPDQDDASTQKIITRPAKMSSESLERLDEDARIQNWDAILTLAHLSSEVFGDGRVKFARDSLKFESATPIDNGDRHSLVCSNSKVLVVVFRGTETLTDTLHDVALLPVGIGAAENGYETHSGFHMACQSLYKDLIREIDRQDGRNKSIIITGHSLGGAMAVMFAYLAETTSGLNVNSIVTFGQPLLANESFANQLVQHFQHRHKRVVHRDDLVSRVARPYFHSGARILLVEGAPPRFWKPDTLTQAGPDNVAKHQPTFTTDPDITPLTAEEMIEVKEFTGTKAPLDDHERKSKRDRRRQLRRSSNDSPSAETPVAGTATGGFGDWISHGLEDHKMEYYIKCIEAQEVEVRR